MESVKSFHIDHEKLKPGIYQVRSEVFGKGLFSGTVTTFDLYFTRPNHEPPIDQAAIHTIEHLGAVYLRKNPHWKDEVVYFGPMGSRDGFRLLLWDLRFDKDKDVINLIRSMCKFILSYKGEVPGAKITQCGNYLEHNLELAKYYTEKFLRAIPDVSK